MDYGLITYVYLRVYLFYIGSVVIKNVASGNIWDVSYFQISQGTLLLTPLKSFIVSYVVSLERIRELLF